MMTLAWLHPIGAHAERAVLLGAWSPEPVTLGLTGLATWLYFRGLANFRRGAGPASAVPGPGKAGPDAESAGTSRRRAHAAPIIAARGAAPRALLGPASRGGPVAGWQAASFVGGIVAILVALVSPLDHLAEELFSAHMVQHELLMLVAAPLLVLARPDVVMLWALAPASRLRVGRLPRRPGLKAAWTALTAPLTVWLLHGAALWTWHIPGLYDAALGSPWIHGAQHACFFGTAALFWWALVHGRFGRLGYGVAVVFVFLTAMHSGALGALLTVAPRPWYPPYLSSAADWGLSPLEDQQLGGLLMWVPAGAVFVALGIGLFAAWLAEAERRVTYSQSERLARAAAGRRER